MKTNNTLVTFVSINSSLHRKVICTVAISNNELYNNNIRNIKIRESKRSIDTLVISVLNLHLIARCY